MAGLVRKKITVRGKRKSFQRTVMVRANQSKTPYLRKKSARSLGSDMDRKYLHGQMAVLGGAIGLNAARRASRHDTRLGSVIGKTALGGFGGAAAGYGVGHMISNKVSRKTARRLGHAAGIVGSGLSIYNAYRAHTDSMKDMRSAFARVRQNIGRHNV